MNARPELARAFGLRRLDAAIPFDSQIACHPERVKRVGGSRGMTDDLRWCSSAVRKYTGFFGRSGSLRMTEILKLSCTHSNTHSRKLGAQFLLP